MIKGKRKRKTYHVRVSALILLAGLVLAGLLAGCGANQPPTATISAPEDGARLATPTVQFQGTGEDPEKKALSFHWDFGDGGTSTQQNPSHTYEAGGDYTVTLTVTDSAKKTAEAQIRIHINQPPTAQASVKPLGSAEAPAKSVSGEAPLSLSFEGSKSSDPDGTITQFQWDFGDGSQSSEADPTHTYTQPGEYTVTLTVTDDAGVVATDTVTVSVKEAAIPPPPPPQTGQVHEVLMITDPEDPSKNSFEPALLTIQPGDTVRWINESGIHTTTAYHPANGKELGIPAEAEGWDSGLFTEQGATFEYVFTVEGSYAYFCVPHEALGMVGLIVVGRPTPLSEEFLSALPQAAQEELREYMQEVMK